MLLSEAVEAVSRMLDTHPNGKNAAKAYIGAIASVLTQYPRSIATRCADPVNGVMRECEFLPTVAKVVAWLDPRVQTMQGVVDFERLARDQLAERKRLEQQQAAISTGDRAATVARIRAEMAAAGMPIMGDHRQAHGETAETVMARHGLSQADWDAIPDGDPGAWERLQARHAKAAE